MNINKAHKRTVGPVSNEVPESAIAEHRDAHIPNNTQGYKKN